MPNIVWTQDERKKLAFAVYYFLKNDPSKTKLYAINRIQYTVLLPSRRRRITSYSSVKNWLESELDLLKENETNVIINEKISTELLFTELSNLIKKSEETILHRLSYLEKLININKQKIQKVKKKKILIVGLIHKQFNDIKSEFDDKFDLKLWANDGSNTTLRQMIKYSDHVIIMTNFISHSIDATVAQSNVKFTRISGGISTLKDELNNFK